MISVYLNPKDIQLINGNIVFNSDEVDIDIDVSSFSLTIELPSFEAQKLNLLFLTDKLNIFQKGNKVHIRNKETK